LLFGGETLKNFAFALMIGIASGAYSSIFIASPVLTEWKEREGGYRGRRARIVRELGAVPAYATALGGQPVDVEPAQDRKRTRRGSITAPDQAGEQISRDEFQELVRDLDVDGEPKQKQRGRAAVVEEEQPIGDVAPKAVRDPAADLTPEDLVLKDDPKKRDRAKRPRNKRHGRSR
jgi:SecD/SecF fusion protein